MFLDYQKAPPNASDPQDGDLTVIPTTGPPSSQSSKRRAGFSKGKAMKRFINTDFAISLVLLVSVTAVSIFAIIGVIDGWPRLELVLYGPKPV